MPVESRYTTSEKAQGVKRYMASQKVQRVNRPNSSMPAQSRDPTSEEAQRVQTSKASQEVPTSRQIPRVMKSNIGHYRHISSHCYFAVAPPIVHGESKRRQVEASWSVLIVRAILSEIHVPHGGLGYSMSQRASHDFKRNFFAVKCLRRRLTQRLSLLNKR